MSDQKPTRPQTRFGIDLIAGCVCLIVSIYVIFMSIKFWKEDFVEVFYYSSGLMPMIIGGCLCIFSILYIIRTLKDHSFKECITDIKSFGAEFVRSRNVHRSLIGIVIFWVYIFLMLGKMPFWLATFLALSALLMYLNFRRSVWHVVKLLIISVFATFAIVLVFQIIFKVPMP